MIDPIGLALENFDVTGAWRIRDNGMPVDAASTLYDGTPLAGPADLQHALLTRSDVLVQTFAENLMTYALGRRLAAADMPAVRGVVRQAAAADYRFSAFVLGIVQTPGVPDEGAPKAPADDRGRRRRSTRPMTDHRETDDVVHHRKARRAADDAARHGRHGGAAVPRRDGAGARAAERHGHGRVARSPAAGLHRDGARRGRRERVGRHPAPVVAGGDRDATSTSADALSPLEPFRKYLTIVSDTDVRNAEAITPPEIGGDHFRSSAVFLTQAHPKQTESSDVRAGVSLDQIYAQTLRPGHADSRRCSCASRTSTRPAAAPTATRASTPT